MSLFPISILIVAIAFGASIAHLNQSAKDYFDLVAMLLVLFGTLAVALVTIPWKYKADLKISLHRLFRGHKTNYKKCLTDSMDYLQSPFNTTQNLKSNHLYLKVLKDGYELKSLNLPTEKIEIILNERIQSFLDRQKKISNSIKGLAKYPPAFGLPFVVAVIMYGPAGPYAGVIKNGPAAAAQVTPGILVIVIFPPIGFSFIPPKAGVIKGRNIPIVIIKIPT